MGFAPEDYVGDQATESAGNGRTHRREALRQCRFIIDNAVRVADNVGHDSTQTLSAGHSSAFNSTVYCWTFVKRFDKLSLTAEFLQSIDSLTGVTRIGDEVEDKLWP